MSKPYKGNIIEWKRRHFDDGYCIIGIPQGHPDFQDWIRTSRVLKEEKINEGHETLIETQNSEYILVGGERDTEIPCPANNYLKHGITPP
jgi:hypothetical protein